jgi:hypothetical protein
MLRGGWDLVKAVPTLSAFNLGAALDALAQMRAKFSAFNTQLISAVAFEAVVIRTTMLGFLFARVQPTLQTGRFSDAIGRIAVTLCRSGFRPVRRRELSTIEAIQPLTSLDMRPQRRPKCVVS